MQLGSAEDRHSPTNISVASNSQIPGTGLRTSVHMQHMDLYLTETDVAGVPYVAPDYDGAGHVMGRSRGLRRGLRAGGRALQCLCPGYALEEVPEGGTYRLSYSLRYLRRSLRTPVSIRGPTLGRETEQTATPSHRTTTAPHGARIGKWWHVIICYSQMDMGCSKVVCNHQRPTPAATLHARLLRTHALSPGSSGARGGSGGQAWQAWQGE
ncbi:hypothetical protein GGR56DRAFT_597950 [Xylariaceae sp. FL0804]|nr:hypothetical protein GGR56DRAFT_597950 [Xylariaceae sp. FL0804]